MADDPWTPHLHAFVAESNRIEGIVRLPTEAELDATARFLRVGHLEIWDVVGLAKVYEPGVVLRAKPGLNVRVGNHVAPPGGPLIEEKLAFILKGANHAIDPWQIHCEYEHLHPLTDSNGRSGRALWAWQMVRLGDDLSLGFLCRWYYQSLEHAG